MSKEQKAQIVEIAKSLTGKPYKYGARPEEAPNSFDCSSFIQYIFKQIGIELPRNTILQAGCGEKISDIKDIKQGDLLFFRGTRGFYNQEFPEGIGHVVLYIGEGKTIHAVSRRVQENPQIIEVGQVEEKPLEEIIEKLSSLTVIKRIIQ